MATISEIRSTRFGLDDGQGPARPLESGPSALPQVGAASYGDDMRDGTTIERPADRPDEMFDARLTADHDQLVSVVSALEREGLDLEPESTSVGELTAAGQHPADLASETFERERDLALLSEFRGELEANEDAAVRLATGRYGWCEDCEQPIDRARLVAVPAATRCKACQDRFELDSLLQAESAGRPPVEPDDLSQYLPDDDGEPDALLAPEEAALHIES